MLIIVRWLFLRSLAWMIPIDFNFFVYLAGSAPFSRLWVIYDIFYYFCFNVEPTKQNTCIEKKGHNHYDGVYKQRNYVPVK